MKDNKEQLRPAKAVKLIRNYEMNIQRS